MFSRKQLNYIFLKHSKQTRLWGFGKTHIFHHISAKKDAMIASDQKHVLGIWAKKISSHLDKEWNDMNEYQKTTLLVSHLVDQYEGVSYNLSSACKSS